MPRFSIGDATNLILALFQALLFLATIGQLKVAQQAAKDAREGLADTHTIAMAAKESADTARRSMELTERAVLVFTAPAFIDLKSAHFPIIVTNVGNTIAKDAIFQISEGASYKDQLEDDAHANLMQRPQTTEDEIDPHNPGSGELTVPVDRNWANDIASRPDGVRISVFVYGQVDYQDVFGHPHTGHFAKDSMGRINCILPLAPNVRIAIVHDFCCS